MFRPLVLGLLLFLSASSERGAALAQDDPPPTTENKSGDATILFDGKSLTGWMESDFGGQREVSVVDETIQLAAGDPLTGITYDGEPPTNNYELTLEARRLQGTDFFCATTFPVEDSHCTLVLGGWGGTVVGLSCLDDKDASENETTQYVKFERERWYAVRIRVAGKRIQCWLDDALIADVAYEGRKISLRAEVVRSRPLGVCSFATTAQLRNIRLSTVTEADAPTDLTPTTADRPDKR